MKELELEDFVFQFKNSTPSISNKKKYLTSVNDLINNIRRNNIDKVVFSRIVEKSINKNLSTIFKDLCAAYPSAFVYVASIKGYGTWIGATPELFVDIEGSTLKTTALAGTKDASSKPWGEKEIIEQKLVSDFIESELKKTNGFDIKKNGPYTLDTGNVFHLKTDFSCQIDPSSISTLINNLHPTPATCGLPKDDAMATVLEIESHDRLLYTGFLGPVKNGNAKLFVNLRCMQIINNSAYLYVGGGITADSVAELEWDETVNKSKTLLPHLI